MYIDANKYGFLPENSGIMNQKALQRAMDESGTISVNKPGVYDLAGTVYIKSYTTIRFGNGVFIRKSDEEGEFTHVFINKGALAKEYDEHIRIENLYLISNGMHTMEKAVFGLRGHVAFFYIKDLIVEGFRCMDLGATQFAIHICTFEDIIVRDVIIKGDKDGVHLGTGRRFYIGNGVFQTYDDAIALNAQDYDVCNPELGWIEDGIIENCRDLDDDKERKVGFFCRMLAGGWLDWYKGMEVQKSDTVVSNNRIYRVRAEADGRKFISKTKPVHKEGEKVLDGINWVMVQEKVEHNAAVRNVIFRNIFLYKPRIGFAPVFEGNRFNRSYYKGAELPVQTGLSFDNIKVLHEENRPFMEITSPVDHISVSNSNFENTSFQFFSNCEVDDFKSTVLQVTGCTANQKAEKLVDNKIQGKVIETRFHGNVFE